MGERGGAPLPDAFPKPTRWGQHVPPFNSSGHKAPPTTGNRHSAFPLISRLPLVTLRERITPPDWRFIALRLCSPDPVARKQAMRSRIPVLPCTPALDPVASVASSPSSAVAQPCPSPPSASPAPTTASASPAIDRRPLIPREKPRPRGGTVQLPSTFLISPTFFWILPSTFSGLAVGFQLGIADQLAGRLLDAAGDVLGRAFCFVLGA